MYEKETDHGPQTTEHEDQESLRFTVFSLRLTDDS